MYGSDIIKRIVIICLLGDPFLPAVSIPHSGGYNIDTLELLEYMITQKEWECVVITNKSNYIVESQQKMGENIIVHRIDIPEIFLKNQNLIPCYYADILKQIEKILNAYNMKVNLVHSYYWLSGKIAYDLKQKYDFPFVHSVVSLSSDKINCNENPNCYLQFDWEKTFLNAADYVMTITDAESQSLTEIYKIDSSKIVIVGRGVHKAFEYPMRTPYGIPSGLTYNYINKLSRIEESEFWNNGAFLYMGRLNRIKGIQFIFKAWYNLYMTYKETTPPLWIVGGTPDEIAETRIQISEIINNLHNFEKMQKIIWWGYLNAEGISTLLLKTLVLVTHSKFEAGGRVIIEAMSSGTPVISTPTGFGIDYIIDWNNGFLIPYSDVDFLTHRMRHFINQPLLSNSLGNIASLIYKKLKNKFNCYEKHLMIYNNIVENEEKSLLGNNDDILASIKKEIAIGHLTTYPYATSDIHQNYIEKIVTSNFNLSCDNFKKIKQDLWLVDNYDEKYIIKKLYSKINFETIWFPSSNPIAFTPQMRLDIILNVCSKYAPCLQVYDSCDVNCIIVIEHCHSFSSYPNFQELLDCLLKQKKTHCIMKTLEERVLTQESILRKLDNAAKNKISPQWCKIWNDIESQFKDNLNLSKKVTDYCYCYGKSYLEHAVEYNEEIYLLPSDTIFIAEWGYDFAELLTEYYIIRDWDTAQYIKAYHMTLKKTNTENDIFLPLCLCSLVMRLIKNTVLLYSSEDKLLELIKYLMDFMISP